MATVTGLTAAKMLELAGENIIAAEIVGDNLILTTRDGAPIDAGVVVGPVGPTGATGATGAAGSGVLTGAGSPEGVITASPGAFYMDTTSAIAYEKKSGVGTNTGWKKQVLDGMTLLAENVNSGLGNVTTASTAGVICGTATSFVAPPSGIVMVEVSGMVGIGTKAAGAAAGLGFAEAGTLVMGRYMIDDKAANEYTYVTSPMIVGSLTPGASKTYSPWLYVSNATYTAKCNTNTTPTIVRIYGINV